VNEFETNECVKNYIKNNLKISLSFDGEMLKIKLMIGVFEIASDFVKINECMD